MLGTSMGNVCMSSWILRCIFSVTLSSSPEKKPAALMTELEMCAFLKLICRKYSHAFQSACGIACGGKKRGTDLLSVRTTVGFVVSHKMCANSGSAT